MCLSSFRHIESDLHEDYKMHNLEMIALVLRAAVNKDYNTGCRDKNRLS